jgi:hypothetical protein
MADADRASSAPPRLIFVDGLPGSGKSTTAQRLCFHWQRLGRPACWYFEHEQGHPLFDDEQVRLARVTGPTEPNRIFDRALAGCAALVERLRGSDETVILESSLFQTTVGTQLLMDVPAAEIAAHFRRSLEILAPLVPALVRFRPAEAAAALRRTAEKRGAWFSEFLVAHLADTPRGRRTGLQDFEGALAFFGEYRAVCDGLFAQFPGPRLTVDNSAGDWPRHTQAITDFLGLPPLADPPPPADAAELTGRYRAETGDEWHVAADARGLFLDDAAAARLWPQPAGGFAIEGLCVALAFERGASGRVVRVRCTGALPGLAPVWEKV